MPETDRRIYKNPPIEEALCEFRFVPQTQWDVTTAGRLYEKFKNRYPAPPRQQAIAEAQFEAAPQPSGTALRVLQRSKLQFIADEGNRIVAVAPDALSVHVLRPYEGWENFKPRIEDALRVYVDFMTPEAVARITVRYINRIVVHGEAAKLSDYFTFPPQTPSQDFPRNLASFFVRLIADYDEMPARLTTTMTNLDAPAGESAILLDLDLVWDQSANPMPLAEVMPVVERLRHYERLAFESMITDASRDLFDAST